MVVSDLVRTLLLKRGVSEPEAMERFLAPDYGRDTHQPQLLHSMEHAVSRLLAAITQNERIALYADYDCDGIPGAALLYDFFKKIGYTNFTVYIPHRDREGYGFHIHAIEKLSREGVSLIVTIDVGTNAVEAISYAREKGVDVVVTDHHEPNGLLPDAVSVLNPKLGGYPFHELCGTAVAWKLVCATLAEGRTRELPAFLVIPDGWEKWLLDLVAIATVADMVPLVGENRTLVYFGLKTLHKSPRAGIRALCNLLRLQQHELTENDIGFSIAPRVNAASRMDDPELAFRLFVTQNISEAERVAQELERLNTTRKSVVGVVVKEAKKRVRARFRKEERVVVLGNAEWKPSLLGLAANSVLGERSGVVCLWGKDANGDIKGSCRSDGSLSVTELFLNARDVLKEFGGHTASGGFSVSHQHIHALQEAFSSAASRVSCHNSTQEKNGGDVVVSLAECSWGLFQELSCLAPFGVGNPKPTLRILGSCISTVRRFGKNQEHTEVRLMCEKSRMAMRCFQFFVAPENFSIPLVEGKPATMLATLERDSYRGPQALALRVVDVLAP